MYSFKRLMPVLLCLMLSAFAAYADEELSINDILIEPRVSIEAPISGGTYEIGGALPVKAYGNSVQSLEAVLTWTDSGGQQQSLSYKADGDVLEYTFECGDMCYASELVITGKTQDQYGRELTAFASRRVLSPKEDYINRMIDLAEKNSKQAKYKFAPAESDTDIGVCKNFVMRLFDTFKSEYRMLAYPELPMHMPKNKSKKDSAPYDYGLEWRYETAEEGSPFEIVAQFKYNKELSEEENAAIARDLMHMVRKGDFFQMVGYYGGGNGPHSLFFIADYDPETDILRWTDSNMKGKRVDGIRWGYMQFDKPATAEWYVEVFNMKNRGATLYRLRDDLYRPAK